jgi:hypothetical protein
LTIKDLELITESYSTGINAETSLSISAGRNLKKFMAKIEIRRFDDEAKLLKKVK